MKPGQHIPKSADSQCVINIVPPRNVWAQLQSIRTKYIYDARCAIHISFIDPFVLSSHYEEAAKLLQKELADFPPFTIKMNKLDFFAHGKNSYTLYIAPECDPPTLINDLMGKCLNVFPQCDDTIKRGGGKLVPHFSLAKFKSKNELEKVMLELSSQLKPIEFTLQELYFLKRDGSNPFEVMNVVPLGNKECVPYYGIKSVEKTSRVGRTVVVFGMSKAVLAHLTDDFVADVFKKSGLTVTSLEIIRNPDSKLRSIVTVEFDADAEKALGITLPLEWDGAKIRPLSNMVFPDVCHGSCSLVMTATSSI